MEINELRELQSEVKKGNAFLTEKKTQLKMKTDQRTDLVNELSDLGHKNIADAKKFVEKSIKTSQKFVDDIKELRESLDSSLSNLESGEEGETE